MDETNYSESVPLIRARLLKKMGENAGEYPSHVEQRFPRILARIAELWGSPELDAYLEELILPDRPGRQGFPHEVGLELFRLAALHDALRLAPKPSASGWASIDEVSWQKDEDKEG